MENGWKMENGKWKTELIRATGDGLYVPAPRKCSLPPATSSGFRSTMAADIAHAGD
jgi:hypothetical protein